MCASERLKYIFQLIFHKQTHCGRCCSDPNAQQRCQSRTRRLIAVSAGFLLIGGAAFAANDVSGEPASIPAVKADAQLAALLLQVEQQIVTGHAFSPPSDSAVNTWPRVLQGAVPTSPGA